MGVPAKFSLGRLGPYELLHKLAVGGMSEIYEARRAGPHGFSKRVALKRILPQLVADEELVAMFVDEARLSAQLSHPNLVQVLDFGEEQGDFYMAMELVEGTTGAKLVREVARRRETVPTDLALFIGLSIARGLEHAHEACDEEGKPLRLVHRDVSPGNVLLSRSGAVKLSDFGIARAAFLERRTEHGQLKGKLGYMSPEQVLGRELDEKSDQFSLGIVLAEMLIGRPLFGGGRDIDILVRIRDADLSSLARHGSHISDDVRSLLFRALARRSEDRFPSTRAFVDAIEDVMRRAGLLVRPAELAAYLERIGLARLPWREAGAASSDLDGVRLGPRLARTEPRDPPTARRYSPFPASLLRVAEPLDHDGAPAWYRIMLESGELGPLPLAELAKLFATGLAQRNTLIAREHQPYREAHEIGELERLCASSAALLADPAHEGPVERLSIVRNEWPSWLLELMLARKTGLLRVRHGPRKTKAFFVEGVLETTASTEPADLLGSLLVAAGTVKKEQIDRAITLSHKHGSRMGEALVAMGVLRPMALARALVMQARRRFIELLAWPAGEASFFEGARSFEEDTMMPDLVPPLDLVTQGIREGYAPREIAEILAKLLDTEIAPSPRSPVGLGSLRLTRPEAMVLERIEGECRVSELVEACERENLATREEAYRAIFIGLSMKIVVVRE